MQSVRPLQLIVLLFAISSVSGVCAKDNLKSLQPEQLDAAVNASIVIEKSGIFKSTADAANFVRLAETVAAHGTIEQVVRIFDIAAKRLDTLKNTNRWLVPVSGTRQAAEQITSGLTTLLTSDTNGVFRELIFDSRFDDGRALTNYIEQLVRSNQIGEIASIQTQLLLGNSGLGNPEERFNEVVDELAINAGKLGYFSGAVLNALDSINASNKEKLAVEQNIVGITAGILTGSVNLAYPATGFAIGTEAQTAQLNVEKVLALVHAEIGDFIIGSTMPVEIAANKQIVSSLAFAEFQKRRSQVEQCEGE